MSDARLGDIKYTRELAEFAVAPSFEDLDAEAVAAAKTFLMDVLAVGVAGSSYEGCEIAYKVAQSWGQGGAARVFGRKGSRLPAVSAAFVNGAQSHCLEWDPLHDASVSIALCTPAAALAAEVETRPVSGRALLHAVTLAVEVAVMFSFASNALPRFFPHSVKGVISSAIAISKLRGFTVDETMNAIGLAYSQAAGTMQAHWEGAMSLASQIGFAARGAMCAADLAEAGMQAPLDVIDGKFGFFKLYLQNDGLEASFKKLGAPWKITGMAHKPFPAGRATQATLTVLSNLRAAHGFSAADVEKVHVAAPPFVILLVARPPAADMTAIYARLCLKFVAPLMLKYGEVNPARFTPADYADPDLVALGEKFEIVDNGNPDEGALGPQTITVRLKDGREFVEEIDAPLGAPGNPLSLEGQHEKIRRCFALSQTPLDPDVFIHIMGKAETLDDARAIFDTLTTSHDAE